MFGFCFVFLSQMKHQMTSYQQAKDWSSNKSQENKLSYSAAKSTTTKLIMDPYFLTNHKALSQGSQRDP